MGLEIGSLAEVYRNSSPRRVCQIELTDNYEHKHQPLSADDPGKGLRKMSLDVAQALLRAAAAEAIPITQDWLRSLPVLYQRYAKDIVDRYEADAVVNRLLFDRHEGPLRDGDWPEAVYGGLEALDSDQDSERGSHAAQPACACDSAGDGKDHSALLAEDLPG